MGPPHPDRVPAVRVLLVGDSGCGKTSLARLLAEGAAPAEAPLPTQGCDVFVRLVQVPDPGGGAPRPHFVELWDVGADAQHAALRPLFYAQAAGVILVHDLTRRRSAAGLGAWASELATAASFAPGALAGGAGAAPPSALATHLRDLGLPVPALVIGTKADVAERRRRSALGAWLSAAASAATGPARRCLQGLRVAASRRGLGRPPRPSGTGALLPEYATRQEREAQLFAAATLRSAAPLGRVDMLAVDAFFRALLAARQPTGGHSRNVSSSSAPGSPTSRWAGMLSADVALAEVPSYARRYDALMGADAGREGRLAWPDDEEGGGRGPGGERALWSP